MSKIVYDLSFNDVVADIFTFGGWFQGENFSDGVFIRLDEFGDIHVYQFLRDRHGEQDYEKLTLNSGVYKQKYRRVSTQSDIMRK